MRQALIIDLDGTLCNSTHVVNFTGVNGAVDWDKLVESAAFAVRNDWCAEIVSSFAAQNYHIIFLTARSGTDRYREITEQWLSNFGFNHMQHTLLMRSAGDDRPDHIVKEELYLKEVAPNYDVLFAVDDKYAVIAMWRKLGIPALHCADY